MADSTEKLFIDAIRAALTSAGFSVFDSILDRHTGRRTRSKTYVELGRGWERDMDEITTDCIQGEYSYRLRYHQGKTIVKNNAGQMQTFSDACQTMESAIAQVKTAGLFTRPKMRIVEAEGHDLQGIVRDYELTGTVTSSQDRSPLFVAGNYFIDDDETIPYFVDDSNTDQLSLSVGTDQKYFIDDDETDVYYTEDDNYIKLEVTT